MPWDAVKRVLLDHRHGSLVFEGDGQRLVVLGPMFWSWKARKRKYDQLLDLLERRAVPVTYRTRAAYLCSKNTRLCKQ